MGWQPFILSFESSGANQLPLVRGGSWYTSCRQDEGALDAILAAGQNNIAGAGIYQVDAQPHPLYMMWSPRVFNELGFFAEYIIGKPSTRSTAAIKPFSGSVVVALPWMQLLELVRFSKKASGLIP